MTKLISYSKNFKSDFVFTDFFENQEVNIALLIDNIEDKPFLKELNSTILNKILNLHLQDIDKNRINTTLKEFFVELNSKINTNLKKYSIENDGISLLLLIVKNHQIFMIQFGRILAGVITDKGFEEFGKSWQNSDIKNCKELNLLGCELKDINVKIHKKDIEKTGKFIAVSSDIIQKIDFSSIRQKDLENTLKQYYKEQKFTYILFDMLPAQNVLRHKSSLSMRVKISLYAMIAIILISTGYVYFGKNWLQNTQEDLREKNSAFIKNELMESLLEKQNQIQDILDQIFSGKIEMSLFSNNKISIKEVWTQDFKKPITLKPFFDIKHIYIAQKNELSAISRINKKERWRIKFEHPITYLKMLKANRMLVSTGDNISCISRNSGKILWEKDIDGNPFNNNVSSDILIDLNEFSDFDSGIVLTTNGKKLTLLNNITGEEITSHDFKDNIKYISDYDKIFKSLYIATYNSVTRISILEEI